MKLYTLLSVFLLSLLLSSCVEQETPEFSFSYEFEEEPLHGSLTDYQVSSVDIGMGTDQLALDLYKGTKDMYFIQSPNVCVALSTEDNSLLWRVSRTEWGNYQAPIHDFQGQLLVGFDRNLKKIDASNGQELDEYTLWPVGDPPNNIVALQVVDDIVYTLSLDYPTDSTYALEVHSHQLDNESQERLLTIEQSTADNFYYPYSQLYSSPIPQRLSYDAEERALIFPLFMHEHPDFEYGIHSFTISLDDNQVKSNKMPIRFLSNLRMDWPVQYQDNMLKFRTTHINVFNTEDKQVYWESTGGQQRYFNKHFLRVQSKKASLHNIISGEEVWSSDFPTEWIRSAGVDSEGKYFFITRSDRLSVYDLSTTELVVDLMSDAIYKQTVFFDSRGYLNYTTNQGWLVSNKLEF
jgi:hypothetical protein